jgi:hypothetical protein
MMILRQVGHDGNIFPLRVTAEQGSRPINAQRMLRVLYPKSVFYDIKVSHSLLIGNLETFHTQGAVVVMSSLHTKLSTPNSSFSSVVAIKPKTQVFPHYSRVFTLHSTKNNFNGKLHACLKS